MESSITRSCLIFYANDLICSINKRFLKNWAERNANNFMERIRWNDNFTELVGLVEVIISGFGVNVPSSGLLEDPFYRINPEAADVPVTGPGVLPPIGLHLSFTGCAAQTECGAPHIYPFMIYVDGLGFIQPLPSEPSLDLILQAIPYLPQHVYRFVIDIGANAEFLTLGHGDGGVFDNSGHFAIQLFAVERAKKGGGRRNP